VTLKAFKGNAFRIGGGTMPTLIKYVGAKGTTKTSPLTVPINASPNAQVRAWVALPRAVHSEAGAGASFYITEFTKNGVPDINAPWGFAENGVSSVTVQLEVWNCDAVGVLTVNW
jgi:hypothetical protein